MFLVGIISYIKDKKDFKKIVLIGFSNKEKKTLLKILKSLPYFFLSITSYDVVVHPIRLTAYGCTNSWRALFTNVLNRQKCLFIISIQQLKKKKENMKNTSNYF